MKGGDVMLCRAAPSSSTALSVASFWLSQEREVTTTAAICSTYERVVGVGLLNYMSAHIPVPTNLYIGAWV